jgi:hypothetical protein
MLSSTSDALDCLGLELIDALFEHRASVTQVVVAIEANSGHSAQSFWDACESADALGYVSASKELRGTFGPSAKLTPSAVERLHQDLRRALAYGIWSPGCGGQNAPPCKPFETRKAECELPLKTKELSSEPRPLPPGRTVRIGLIPVYPVQQAKAPPFRKRSPAQPPDYSRITRYRATEKELASAGVSSVDELVERVNEFVERGLQFPVTQADFPNSRKKFERLTALLAKLSWNQTAAMDRPARGQRPSAFVWKVGVQLKAASLWRSLPPKGLNTFSTIPNFSPISRLLNPFTIRRSVIFSCLVRDDNMFVDVLRARVLAPHAVTCRRLPADGSQTMAGGLRS